MFSANGKFISKEGFDNAENEIKSLNKNSQLFYDAEGALRASIMISEYGDFTVATNYGSVKQQLSFNSDGTLRTTGSRVCLDDVCLNKDDILKLKQVQLSDSNNNNSVSETQAATQQAINNAIKKEEVDKAIQDKTNIEIEISQFLKDKEEIDTTVENSRALLVQSENELKRVEIDLESVNKEFDEEQTKLTIANINLLEAQNSGATVEEIENLQEIADLQKNKVDSITETQNLAKESVEKANVSKGTASRDLELRLQEQRDIEQRINTARANEIKAVQTLDLLTS